MIFQNQQAQLHPKMSVSEMIEESLALHQPQLTEAERMKMRDQLLERVGLPDHHLRYLASLSGGEQRRVGLARVLATQPSLIIADEPTSGLDAAIKLQIIALLRELREQNLTYLLISHDLSLVQRIADRVLVMLHGRIIETFPLSELNKRRHHPYTESLIAAAQLGESHTHGSDHARHASIEDLAGQTTGAQARCGYLSVCPLAQADQSLAARCGSARPPLAPLNTSDDPRTVHNVACLAFLD